MSMMKAISAAVILSAAVAAPAFAQEYGPVGGPYGPGYGPPAYYRSYGQVPGDYPPQTSDEYWSLMNHGFTGRDPSRVGSDSPSVNPSGS
ncbi:hypothetical protein [Bradyrhizobium sp.]|uniref:hypothetical protein n=1 Tax=Bradyrhizobium sp. TaxID=376 RepID=UPI00261800C0|nr:hypothetical protein [Bradyrhizobium sp.]